MQQMTQASERIECDVTHKTLAKRDERGIWFWCRACHREHLIPWKDIPVPKSASEAAFLLNALIGQ